MKYVHLAFRKQSLGQFYLILLIQIQTPTLRVQSQAFLQSNHKCSKLARLDSDICQILIITLSLMRPGLEKDTIQYERQLQFASLFLTGSTTQYNAKPVHIFVYMYDFPKTMIGFFNIKYYFMHVLK